MIGTTHCRKKIKCNNLYKVLKRMLQHSNNTINVYYYDGDDLLLIGGSVGILLSLVQ